MQKQMCTTAAVLMSVSSISWKTNSIEGHAIHQHVFWGHHQVALLNDLPICSMFLLVVQFKPPPKVIFAHCKVFVMIFVPQGRRADSLLQICKCKNIRNNQFSGMLLSFTICVCLCDHLFEGACLAIEIFQPISRRVLCYNTI